MTRLRSTLALTLGILAGALCLLLLPRLGVAHAQAVATTVTEGSPPLGLMEWIGIGLAALGGIKAIVDIVLAGLKWLAPRTATKIDDTARDDLQLVHDKLDALTALVGGIVPSKVIVNVPAPARDPQAGRIGGAVLLALSFLGLLGIAVAASSCAASGRETAIKATFLSVDSARDGFLAYDRAHEIALTAHCDPAVETREACAAKVAASTAKLAEYQAQRAKIDPLFVAAYRSVTAAQILNTDQSIAGMAAAAGQLFAAVKPFLGGK